jgi:hypothetical protein
MVDEPGHFVEVPGDLVDDDHFITTHESEIPEEGALSHALILP